MGRYIIIFLFYAGFISCVDLIVLGVATRNTFILLAGIFGFGGLLYFVSRHAHTLLKPQILTGWMIGRGIDITNPDHPKKVNVVIPDKALALGFLGVGAPGSGKTVSLGVGYLQYLKHTHPEHGWGILDGKGDVDYYEDLFRAGVQPDYYLSSELPYSHSINLMDGDPLDVADRCTRFLVPETLSTSFYSDEQKATLYKLVPLLKSLGTSVSLRDLYTVITVNEAQIELLQLAKKSDVDESILSMAKSWFDTDYDDRLSLNKGLINRLYVFVAGVHTDRFNAYDPDIVIGDCMREGRSIFFHLPYSDLSISVAVAIVEIFGIEAKKRQLAGAKSSIPYPLLFEDYGGFFHSNFGPIASRCRSAKMPINFTFQSMAHLQKVNSTFLDEIDDTVQSKIFFRVMGAKTAAFAVNMMDQYETRELGQTNSTRNESQSVHTVSKDRIKATEMRELNPGEAFISTLIQDKDGRNKNALYRAQFTQAKIVADVPVSLPNPEKHEGTGLGLWDKYMTPSQLKALHAKLIDEMAAEAESV